jgi:hypothetical protein
MQSYHVRLTKQLKSLKNRVTRFGRFFTQWVIVYLGQLLENYPGQLLQFTLGSCSNLPWAVARKLQKDPTFLGYSFPRLRLCANFATKLSWATLWAIFFTNSSGRPAHKRRKNVTRMPDDSGRFNALQFPHFVIVEAI